MSISFNVLAEVNGCSGTDFSPSVLKTFCAVVADIFHLNESGKFVVLVSAANPHSSDQTIDVFNFGINTGIGLVTNLIDMTVGQLYLRINESILTKGKPLAVFNSELECIGGVFAFAEIDTIVGDGCKVIMHTAELGD